MFIFAALSLGFLGSFHCIGMCGPIAMAIPVKKNSYFSIFTGALIYNMGRIVTYTCLGLLFGLLGKGFVLAGWQNFLSVALGVCILILLFIPHLLTMHIHTGFFIGFIGKLKSKMRLLFGIHTMRSLFIIGVLNGLLPCGLVYLGITGALAMGDTINGTLFMLAFGLGTLPTMLFITFIRDYISARFRNRIKKMIPVFITVMALLLILRGLNLGIPYISPSTKINAGIKSHTCCQPAK